MTHRSITRTLLAAAMICAFASPLLSQVPDGHYVASTYRRATFPGQLYSIDPSSRQRPQIPEPFDRINAMACERVTGDLIVAGHLPGGRYEVYRLALSTTGAATRLGQPPGALSGIDIDLNPEVYGTPTPGSNTYAWQLAALAGPDGLSAVPEQPRDHDADGL